MNSVMRKRRANSSKSALTSVQSICPRLGFFFSCPSFLDKPREETLATQAKSSGEELSFVISEGDVGKVNYR